MGEERCERKDVRGRSGRLLIRSKVELSREEGEERRKRMGERRKRKEKGKGKRARIAESSGF